MAKLLDIVYSVAILLVALGGVGYVFAVTDGVPESPVSRWGELAALALFLVALVAFLVI